MVCAMLLLLSVTLPQPTQKALAQTDGRFYAETGYTLAAEFVDFFDSHGGVPVFGYPVSEARQENGYLVQWTERQRLEWHPENAGTDFEVLLGLLGRELTKGLDGPLFDCGMPNSECGRSSTDVIPNSEFGIPQSDGHYFPQTGQYVSDLFLITGKSMVGSTCSAILSRQNVELRTLNVGWPPRLLHSRC